MKKVLTGAVVASCLSMGTVYGLNVSDVLQKCDEIDKAAQLDKFRITLSCGLNSQFIGPAGMRKITEQRAPTNISIGLSMGKGEEQHDAHYKKVYSHDTRDNQWNCSMYQKAAQIAQYERTYDCSTFRKELEVARAGGRGAGQEQQGKAAQQQQQQRGQAQLPDHMQRGDLDDVAKLCMHSVIDFDNWNSCTSLREQHLQATEFNFQVSKDQCQFVKQSEPFGCGAGGKEGPAGGRVAQGQQESTDLGLTNNIPAGLLTTTVLKYDVASTEQTKDYVNETRTQVVKRACTPFHICEKEIELMDEPQAGTIFAQMGLHRGDHIRKVNGEHFSDADALRAKLYMLMQTGTQVDVKYVRAGKDAHFVGVLQAGRATDGATTVRQGQAQQQVPQRQEQQQRQAPVQGQAQAQSGV